MSDAMADEKKGLVPKLRFPEFQDEAPWAIGELDDGNVANLVSERINPADVNLASYVSTENLLPDFDGVTTASKQPSSGSLTKFQYGDVLLANIRPYLKKVWFANIHGGASNDVIVIRSQDAVSADFLLFIIKQDAFITYVMRGAKGVKMPRGDIALIRKYPVPYPRPAEQQKIADCLSSLDELIAAHTDKLGALKTHKKGLLQQLFPREGETVPRLRFPEFRNAGVWRYEELAQFVTAFLDGDWIESKDQSEEGIRLLQTGNVGFGQFISRETHARYISRVTFDRLNCTEVFPGDGLISRLPDPVGRMCIVPNLGQRMITAVDCTILRFKESFIDSYFALAYSQTEGYIAEVESWSSGSTRKRISKKHLALVKIPLPPSRNEQQKIANCLSALDNRITAQADKIEALRQHKKGLLQQLFPAMDEIDS